MHLAQEHRYGLGYRVQLLEQGLTRQLEVPAPVATAIARLHRDADAAAYYAVYRDVGVVVAHVVDSGRRPRVQTLDVGFHEAMHATAFGKVLLAAMDSARREHYLTSAGLRRLTGHTITDRAELERHLARVSQSSIALEVNEFQDGLPASPPPCVRGRVRSWARSRSRCRPPSSGPSRAAGACRPPRRQGRDARGQRRVTDVGRAPLTTSAPTKGFVPMIIRVFRAVPRAGQESAYERLIRLDSVDLVQAQPGLVALYAGHAIDDDGPGRDRDGLGLGGPGRDGGLHRAGLADPRGAAGRGPAGGQHDRPQLRVLDLSTAAPRAGTRRTDQPSARHTDVVTTPSAVRWCAAGRRRLRSWSGAEVAVHQLEASAFCSTFTAAPHADPRSTFLVRGVRAAAGRRRDGRGRLQQRTPGPHVDQAVGGEPCAAWNAIAAAVAVAEAAVRSGADRALHGP